MDPRTHHGDYGDDWAGGHVGWSLGAGPERSRGQGVDNPPVERPTGPSQVEIWRRRERAVWRFVGTCLLAAVVISFVIYVILVVLWTAVRGL